jgi:alpha-tubulin suppressor-like RCC1 family protein
MGRLWALRPGWMRADGARKGASVRAAASALVAALTISGGALTLATTADAVQPNDGWETAVSSSGPVAWYRLNDALGSSTIADAAGSNNAAPNSVTLGAEGPFRGSGSGTFGATSYATLSADPLLNDTAFTIEAWVNTSSSILEQPIVWLGGGSSGAYLTLTPASAATKHPAALEIVTSSTSAVVSNTKFKEKTWEYLVVTENAEGKLALYLNGSEVASTTTTLSPASLGTSVPDDYIGRPLSSSAARLHGNLSNLVFYSKALTASEVAQHYAAAETPLNTEAPTLEGSAKELSTLTAKPGAWLGVEPIKFSYRWERCGTAGCETIKGASKSTYTLQAADVQSTVRALVTASNAAGESTADSAFTATVQGPPVGTSSPEIEYEAIDFGEARVGELLAVRSSWRAFPLPVFSYAWEECPKTTECFPAEGVGTEAGYRVTSGQQSRGDKLRATVTATNSYGSANASTGFTAKVVPGQPVDVSVPGIEGEAVEGTPLSVASSGTWAGTEPIEFAEYVWLRCKATGAPECHSISGASGHTATSYTTSHEDVGHAIAVEVVAHNSVGSATANSALSASVTQKPLRNVTLPTIEGEAREGQALTAGTGTWEGGAPIEYIDYAWLACHSGSCVERSSGAEDTSYTLGSSDVGDTIELRVTAKNPVAEQSATSAATATVLGNAPSESSAPSIAGVAEDEQTLTASTGEWTGTPTITYAYEWEACEGSCTPIEGATAASYTVGHADVGKTIRAKVTATNSVGHTSTFTAATTAVGASNPVSAAAPSIIENTPGTTTVTADEGSWHGSPPLTYSYQWESCTAVSEEACLPIVGAEEERFTPGAGQVGERLRLLVTVSNAAGSATAASPDSQVVRGGGSEAVAWGENFYGQLGTIYRDTHEDHPVAAGAGLEDINVVGAGGTESLALLDDHELAAWGNNPHGQLGDGEVVANREEDRSFVTVDGPAGTPIEHVAAVAPSSEHSMALGENHWVYAWGNGQLGSLGNGHGGFTVEQEFKLAEPVTALDKSFTTSEEEAQEPVQVAAGGGSDYALLKDGEVMAWGYNDVGQLGTEWPAECQKVPRKGTGDPECAGHECQTGIGWEVCRPTPEPVLGVGGGAPLKGAKAVYASGEAAYALVGDGELLSWGNDVKGQLGQAGGSVKAGGGSHFTTAGYVVRPNGSGGYEHVKGVVEVAAGWSHVLARLASGEVLGWGNNEWGALGKASGTPELCATGAEVQCFKVAQPVRALEPYWTPTPEIEALSAGSQFSDALIGHEVYAFGANEVGQLGVGTTAAPESCTTLHLEEKEKKKFENEKTEHEEEGETVTKTFEPRGRWCSREPLPVLQSGVLEGGEEVPLANVKSVSAGTNNNHTQALLEAGTSQPPSALSVSVEESGGAPAIKVGWNLPSPELPSRLLWNVNTTGPAGDPAETAQSSPTETCEEQELSALPVECPVDETAPRMHLDYEEFLELEETEIGKKPKSEGATTPRLKTSGVGEKITIANIGKWAGETPITYHYQWERCSGESEAGGGLEGEELHAEGCVAIEGADGTITEKPGRKEHAYDYTVTEANLNERIRLSVTATNAASEGTAYSAESQPVKRVGEPRGNKVEQENIKSLSNPGSRTITQYGEHALESGKVYQVKVGAGEFNGEGKQTHYLPRVLIVAIP